MTLVKTGSGINSCQFEISFKWSSVAVEGEEGAGRTAKTSRLNVVKRIVKCEVSERCISHVAPSLLSFLQELARYMPHYNLQLRQSKDRKNAKMPVLIRAEKSFSTSSPERYVI